MTLETLGFQNVLHEILSSPVLKGQNKTANFCEVCVVTQPSHLKKKKCSKSVKMIFWKGS